MADENLNSVTISCFDSFKISVHILIITGCYHSYSSYSHKLQSETNHIIFAKDLGYLG